MPQLERELAYGALKDAMLQPAADLQDSQPAATLQGLQGAQLNGITPAAGVEHGANMQYIYRGHFTIPANQSYTVETLDDSIDTVINIQDYSTGEFVDGNDNCGTRLAGCTGYRSYLKIAPASTAREVWIIVRDYWPHTGTLYDTLRITIGGGPATDYSIQFTGGYHKSLTSFPSSSHFYTVEELGGTHDTVMLLTSGSAAHGIALDDDSGVGYMSTIHAPAACSSVCYVVVGAYSAYQEGSATFVWDENADNPSDNSDIDGLSDTLEGVIGTSPYGDDSDGDGINDDEELLGVEDTQDAYGQLLRFPMYGANPTYPDIFIEADWPECVFDPNDLTKCGDPYNQDYWQMTANAAVESQELFFFELAQLHFDTGVPNTDPGTKFIYNDWGGATRHSGLKSEDICDWLSPGRVGYFHGVRTGGGAGGTGYIGNECSDANWDSGITMAHETGHRLNLSHGGNHSNSLDINCKPNYMSIMNYSWSGWDDYMGVGFSHNQFAGVTLNPTQMDEMAGLGTTDIEFLSNAKFRYKVDLNTGAVDWNRDGRFETTPVRAAPTWGFLISDTCGQSIYAQDSGGYTNAQSTALSHMPWGSSSRLYWFARNQNSGAINYRYSANLPHNWHPSYTSSASQVPSSTGSSTSAPAATWFEDANGNKKLILVYTDSSSRLRYQVLSTVNGQESWSAPAYVGLGPSVDPSPAVIFWRGDVYVYAMYGATLEEWIMSPSGTWSGPVDQQWSDGSLVYASYGLGLTKGFLAGNSLDRLFAAVPLGSPLGQIEMAWKYNPGDRWNRMDASGWSVGQPVTISQPGLAYEPFDPNDEGQGRFYLAWSPPTSALGCSVLLTETEGNSVLPWATSQRLRFGYQIFLTGYQEKDCSSANVSLLFDMDFDSNLRGAFSYYNDAVAQAKFMPIADGIINGTLKDQNDLSVIANNYRCPLGGPCL